MLDLNKYTILNPISDKDRPFVKNGVLYLPIAEKYNYFLEACQETPYGNVEYYLLFGKTKFSQHCRRCRPDNANRLRLILKGVIKDYIYSLCKEEGNCNLEYIESGEDYDVYIIG